MSDKEIIFNLSDDAIWKSLRVAGFTQGLAIRDNKIGIEPTALSYYINLIALSKLIEMGAVKLELVDGIFPESAYDYTQIIQDSMQSSNRDYWNYENIFDNLEFTMSEPLENESFETETLKDDEFDNEDITNLIREFDDDDDIDLEDYNEEK